MSEHKVRRPAAGAQQQVAPSCQGPLKLQPSPGQLAVLQSPSLPCAAPLAASKFGCSRPATPEPVRCVQAQVTCGVRLDVLDRVLGIIRGDLQQAGIRHRCVGGESAGDTQLLTQQTHSMQSASQHPQQSCISLQTWVATCADACPLGLATPAGWWSAAAATGASWTWCQRRRASCRCVHRSMAGRAGGVEGS